MYLHDNIKKPFLLFRKLRDKILRPQRAQKGHKTSYWQRRLDLYYYQVVRDWIQEYSPGDLIMDIGARDTPLVSCGEFKRRVMLDIKPFPKSIEGVEQICANWLEYQPDQMADLVLCLQVLEHLPDHIVKPFARKLVQAGKMVIISVPYMWDPGTCSVHLQDPVDLKKLVGWVGYEPLRYRIEDRDKHQRLIAVFAGKGKEYQ